MNFFSKFKKDENFKKYDSGLKKTRTNLFSKLKDLTNRFSSFNDDFFNELEEVLILADVGVETTLKLIDELKEHIKKEKHTNIYELIVKKLAQIYDPDQSLDSSIKYNKDGLTVILMVGVNGSGKTTSAVKLAMKIKKEGKKVMLVAADTFRAGAIEQLIEWGEKTNIFVFKKEVGSDPASVVFDAIKLGEKENYDVLIIDTAGRLQTKDNLMRELEKINRVITKELNNPPSETLLVIDATTGQNGIMQTKGFSEVTNVTGIILTKLDGTAKGGIVLAIKDKLNIPVKYVGLGEKIDDLEEFSIEKYLYGLFKDLI
jgi:fused signal recognition particle receptor